MTRKSAKKKAPRRLATALALLTVATGGIIGASLAHDEPRLKPHHIDVPMNPTAAMRAFMDGKLGDELPAQSLPAAGSTACVGGSAGSYPCSNVDLLAFMPLADIGGTQPDSEANDIWGWTDPATGDEYAIVGRVFGTSFVDITDPGTPVYVGELPTHGIFGSSWRDI